MTYLTFEKIREGSDPVIRIKYVESYGFWDTKKRTSSKDAIKWHGGLDRWVFMENGDFVPESDPIANFNKSGLKFYEVNVSEK